MKHNFRVSDVKFEIWTQGSKVLVKKAPDFLQTILIHFIISFICNI